MSRFYFWFLGVCGRSLLGFYRWEVGVCRFIFKILRGWSLFPVVSLFSFKFLVYCLGIILFLYSFLL